MTLAEKLEFDFLWLRVQRLEELINAGRYVDSATLQLNQVIERIMSLKISIPGIIHAVFDVRQGKKGFFQTVVLHQPAAKDEFDRVTSREEHYTISIYSNVADDSRFVKREHVGQKRRATLYLSGEMWQDGNNTNYNNKLNLSAWETL